MNAALALISFQWAESALIRTFGKAALLAVGTSYIAVAVVVPTLAALLIRREKAPTPLPAEARDDGVGFLTRLTGWLVRQVVRYPAPYFLAGLIAVVLCGLAYIQLEPHYRLADQVPDQEHALAATSRLDQKLTGANPST